MKTLVIAPHADDEILGAGGTLFKRNSKTKNSIYWLLITMPGRPKYSKNFIKSRENQIKKISKFLKIKGFYNLKFKPSELDRVPKKILIEKISEIFKIVKPNEVFVPHIADVHSDHKVISEVISTCTKNFRFKFIKTILAYEVLSETNFNLQKKNFFKPNYYEDISKFLNIHLFRFELHRYHFLSPEFLLHV